MTARAPLEAAEPGERLRRYETVRRMDARVQFSTEARLPA
jgi:hypothetical protein